MGNARMHACTHADHCHLVTITTSSPHCVHPASSSTSTHRPLHHDTLKAQACWWWGGEARMALKEALQTVATRACAFPLFFFRFALQLARQAIGALTTQST